MRRFIIYDDKVKRQEDLLGGALINLRNCPNVKLSSSIGNFDEETRDCDIIAIHSSMLGALNDVTLFLNNHKKQLDQKYLILFSGSESGWRHESKRRVWVDVKEFYTPRLLPFVEGVCNLGRDVSFLEFQYGEFSDLIPIFEIRHKIWLSRIEGNEDYNDDESLDQVCSQLGLNMNDSNFESAVEEMYLRKISKL